MKSLQSIQDSYDSEISDASDNNAEPEADVVSQTSRASSSSEESADARYNPFKYDEAVEIEYQRTKVPPNNDFSTLGSDSSSSSSSTAPDTKLSDSRPSTSHATSRPATSQATSKICAVCNGTGAQSDHEPLFQEFRKSYVNRWMAIYQHAAQALHEEKLANLENIKLFRSEAKEIGNLVRGFEERLESHEKELKAQVSPYEESREELKKWADEQQMLNADTIHGTDSVAVAGTDPETVTLSRGDRKDSLGQCKRSGLVDVPVDLHGKRRRI